MRLLGAALVGVLFVAVVAAAEAEPYAGEVTASSLNLRAGPGEAYQPVVTVKEGTRVIVLGTYPNDPTWCLVEVPAGYTAWVSADLIEKGSGDSGEVKAQRVLVRPRPSTRYHQLSGRLNKGEPVTIVEEKSTSEGLWYRVKVPRRIPLYAAAKYVKNVGPVSMAEPKESSPAPLTVAPLESSTDRRFAKLEPEVREKLASASTSPEMEPLRRAVADVDRGQLSLDNRERRVRLLADILEKERKLTIAELKSREAEVSAALDMKLEEIEKRYKKRLAEIRDEFEREKQPRYVATGIVQWSPDVFGRYPTYRLVEGTKMRYYLIANQFDLGRFVGKRVGVVGITDPESGTGYETVMVKRIEILGDE